MCNNQVRSFFIYTCKTCGQSSFFGAERVMAQRTKNFDSWFFLSCRILTGFSLTNFRIFVLNVRFLEFWRVFRKQRNFGIFVLNVRFLEFWRVFLKQETFFVTILQFLWIWRVLKWIVFLYFTNFDVFFRQQQHFVKFIVDFSSFFGCSGFFSSSLSNVQSAFSGFSKTLDSYILLRFVEYQQIYEV